MPLGSSPSATGAYEDLVKPSNREKSCLGGGKLASGAADETMNLRNRRRHLLEDHDGYRSVHQGAVSSELQVQPQRYFSMSGGGRGQRLEHVAGSLSGAAAASTRCYGASYRCKLCNRMYNGRLGNLSPTLVQSSAGSPCGHAT